jgi:hypothetical protein
MALELYTSPRVLDLMAAESGGLLMSCTLHGTTSSSRPRIGLQSIKSSSYLWFRPWRSATLCLTIRIPPYNKQPDDLPTEEVTIGCTYRRREVLCQPIGVSRHMKEELCSANELCQLQSYIVYEFLSSWEGSDPWLMRDVFKERFKPTWTMVFSSHQVQ